MKVSLLFFRTALCTALTLSVLPNAHAQSSYTFYPDNATIDGKITTDFVIVGYSGGSYNDDFTRNFTGPASPTVQVAAGTDGAFTELDIFNHSVVNLTGGSVNVIVPQDDSTFNITGGHSDLVLSFDNAKINMSSGSVPDLEGQGKEINVSGGTVGQIVANVSTDVFGNSLGSCIVNITGGEITGDASAFNDGILNLYGGKLGSVLRAAEGGTVNIYGTGLAATLFDPSFGNGYSLYSLSGMLEDGNALNNTILRVRNDGVTYGHSSFNLINAAAVPEPGAMALLIGVGVSGIGMLKRRRLA